jgi:uncharacterized repeat protein (TIGR01451 family)
MKWGIATIIIVSLITVSLAIEINQLQWGAGTSGTFRRGDVTSYMGYSVTVTGLNAPVESDYRNMPKEPVIGFVALNISKNGTFINNAVLRRGESYETPDGELRVTAVEFPAGSSKEWLFESYAPWVKLELSPRGLPLLDQSVNMDDEYISGPNTEIPVNITVKDLGEGDILNVDMEVSTLLPTYKGNLKFHYDKIPRGGKVSETMTFLTPIISELTKYDIIINVSGVDVKDISYNSSMLKTILIAPSSQQMPILRKNSNPKIYLKDYDMVSLSLKNPLDIELKNVTITDTLPKGFKQITNTSLIWLVDVPANGEWTSRYLLRPVQADKDGVLFPAAKAEFMIKNEYYMIQSNKPETIVYGPSIDLKKQTDTSQITPGDIVTVTIVALNKGSTPTRVTINDTIPDDVTLLSGSIMREEYLEADKEVNFSYTIRSSSNGEFTLPAATADYFELGDTGAKISTKSQELLIRIKPPPTPVPTPSPEPTLEPEIEALLTPGSDPSEVPTVKVTEQPELPGTIEQEPVEPSIDSNIILNAILDCDKINSVDPENNIITDVCYLVNNPPSTQSGTNVALSSNGATASDGTNPTMLIDGKTTGYTSDTGFTWAGFNVPLTITLNKQYTINKINVLLWDLDARYYRYKIETSLDKIKWTTVIDKTSGQWKSWQSDTFSALPVRYIRITGTYNSANNEFHVVELEAYEPPTPSGTNVALSTNGATASGGTNTTMLIDD